jgi:hypothetical protein
MDYTCDLIDFNIINNEKNITSSSKINYTEKYDKTTTDTYRIKRLYHIDPLTDIPVSTLYTFKFFDKWDPYTGIRCGIDKIGPLHFDVIKLYDYYFDNRYTGLWNKPSGVFEGYYGELVGSGPNLEIKSRGSNPHKYLFRLPIIDCYLPTDHNYSLVTFGPLLTNDEINLIDNILIMNNIRYKISLKKIKFYYDCALTNDVNDSEFLKYYNGCNNLSITDALDKFNRKNVDELIKLKKY